MDYKNGKIYRIVCNETGLCYVGSTTSTLTKRLSSHKSSYKNYLEENSNYVTSYKILEKGNYDIVLIEEYPCENKQQLHARERYYIETMECVNKIIPIRTKEEIKKYHEKWYDLYKEQNKEKHKEYYKLNKEEISKNHKEYYEKNKEQIREQKKEYNKLHKEEKNEKLKEYRRTAYLNRKEKLKNLEKEKVENI